MLTHRDIGHRLSAVGRAVFHVCEYRCLREVRQGSEESRLGLALLSHLGCVSMDGEELWLRGTLPSTQEKR
jgi:hypothetical protein